MAEPSTVIIYLHAQQRYLPLKSVHIIPQRLLVIRPTLVIIEGILCEPPSCNTLKVSQTHGLLCRHYFSQSVGQDDQLIFVTHTPKINNLDFTRPWSRCNTFLVVKPQNHWRRLHNTLIMINNVFSKTSKYCRQGQQAGS